MLCPACGSKMNEDEHVCKTCGTLLIQGPRVRNETNFNSSSFNALEDGAKEAAEEAAAKRAVEEAAAKKASEEAEKKAASKRIAEEVAAIRAAEEAAAKRAAEEAEKKAAAKRVAEEAEKKAAAKRAAEEAEKKAAAKRAAEEAEKKAAAKRAAEEAEKRAAAKRAAEEAAAKRTAEEAEERAAAKKAAEEAEEKAAAKRAAEEAEERAAAKRAAAKKAAEEAAAVEAAIESAIKSAQETAAKRNAEEAAIKKAAEESAMKKAAEEAAMKKTAEEAAMKKTAEAAEKRTAGKAEADPDSHVTRLSYKIGGGNFPSVSIALDEKQSIFTQSDVMIWMSPGIDIETKTKRSGSPFKAKYTSGGFGQEICIASRFPGEIQVLNIGSVGVIVQKDAFLAAQPTVVLSSHVSMNLGEEHNASISFQRLSGAGMAFIAISGSLIERVLSPDETIKADTANIAAFEESVSFQTQIISDFQNTVFGEGLFLSTLTGPGKIWLQTMRTHA